MSLSKTMKNWKNCWSKSYLSSMKMNCWSWKTMMSLKRMKSYRMSLKNLKTKPPMKSY